MFARNWNRFDNLLWQPWREFEWASRELERLSDSLEVTRQGELPLNLWTGDEGAVVTVQMPGVKVEDIDVAVQDTTLTLTCKRPAPQIVAGQSVEHSEFVFGDFSREVELPFAPDEDHIEATYKSGVLEVRLPRASADKPRHIQITALR